MSFSPVSNALDAATAVAIAKQEYLAAFVSAGGSAVKVYVGDLSARQALTIGLETASRSLGYVCATINSGTTMINRVEQIYQHVARQVPWDAAIQRLSFKALAYARHQSACGPRHINSWPAGFKRRR